jgi:hypothetical protein
MKSCIATASQKHSGARSLGFLIFALERHHYVLKKWKTPATGCMHQRVHRIMSLAIKRFKSRFFGKRDALLSNAGHSAMAGARSLERWVVMLSWGSS